MKTRLLIAFLAVVLFASCGVDSSKLDKKTEDISVKNELKEKINSYVSVPLTTDMSKLDDNQKEIVKLLIEATQIMEGCFWYQALGDKEEFLGKITNEDEKKYAIINFGPWDRLAGNEPFMDGYGEKPKGANFYPKDMTKDEFEKWDNKEKTGLYSFIRRKKDGSLYLLPFYKKFGEEMHKAAELLRKSASLASDEGFKNYLLLRADALESDDFQKSDFAWLDMKSNLIDVVIGPIESYEDQLFGYKASYEGYVLIKDKEWSQKLAKFAKFLPQLQRDLPVDAKYKQEKPGTDTELNAYDVVFYSGDCNAGSKTIAINLPNDEEVQLKKGTRRLQLKNAMKAKFDNILIPIANELIDESQRKHITFDAFFANTMFHEVAHGLGIKNTITGKGTIRKALKEHFSALEEGKADILGLFMIQQLNKNGEIEGDLKDNYVTFMASIFRSVRFGASSAHGKANMIRFNFFKERGAFEFDAEKGTYKINFENFSKAAEELTQVILSLQGDGDYEKVAELVKSKGIIGPALQKDLDRLTTKGIPVDVVFEQGVKTLGL